MDLGLDINTTREEQMLGMKTWAVVGVNQNPNKYGHMIYQKLKQKNYRVMAVNPRYPSIDGDPCYASLADLPEKPDVVNMVVPPEITKTFIKEAATLGIKYIWLQPGTHDDSVMSLIQVLGLIAVQACVLVATR